MFWVGALTAVLTVLGAQTGAVADPSVRVSYFRQIRPILEASCASCHNPDKLKGKLDLSRHASLMKGGSTGLSVTVGDPARSLLIQSVAGDDPEMPLSGDPLTAPQVQLLSRWIEQGALDDTPASTGEAAAPARVARATVSARRLNRTEYNNTVRDLLGTSLQPANEFPVDGVRYGFDRTGDALSTSLLHIEEYEAAATELIAELFARKKSDARLTEMLACEAFRQPREGCQRQIITRFVERAWRRPIAREEATPFVRLAESITNGGGSQTESLQLAFQAVLMSPGFLFHLEGKGDRDASVLAQYRTANRLSYLLWSSMPDGLLFEAARAKELTTPEQLRAQVTRMLGHDKARAFSEDFAAQWLAIQKLSTHAVDGKRFTSWDSRMRDSMKNETLRFFEEFLRSDRPIGEMLTAQFTFVDRHVATLYGVEPPAADAGLVRVVLDGLPRSGLLTQPSILTVASHPNRTSPTGRGLWVMDRILCEPPPPPPPGVEELPASAAGQNVSVKEFLALHRQAATCRVCHDVMDTIGLGFENYNAIGQYRTSLAGEKIEVGGDLPYHGKFGNAVELAKVLARDPRFESCLTKQILTYAVGTGFDDSKGQELIQSVVKRAKKAGGSLRDFISAVVSSEAFLAGEASTSGDAP